ncbi:hypothetical protein [Nitrosophilus alvini]|uniref:hypothetical protein n=1 Tax=Nitrosophilus alvini TaxID=2714855 RepID=UPI00190C79E6|nr:hypothetical protein [Nitrosophilus alvini]
MNDNFMPKGVKIVALAGENATQNKAAQIVNRELMQKDINVRIIGINIREDDFGFFISNLKNSKVEATIFMPEFQKKAAGYFKTEGFLSAVYKKEEGFFHILNDEIQIVDDGMLIKIIEKIGEENGSI